MGAWCITAEAEEREAMTIPTAEEVERAIIFLNEGVGNEGRASNYLRQFAAILKQSDAGREMEDLGVELAKGNRAYQVFHGRRAWQDLARRLAARVAVLEGQSGRSFQVLDSYGVSQEREHWKSEVAIGHEINAKLTAERDRIEAETVERCAYICEQHLYFQLANLIRALPRTRKE